MYSLSFTPVVPPTPDASAIEDTCDRSSIDERTFERCHSSLRISDRRATASTARVVLRLVNRAEFPQYPLPDGHLREV